LKRLDEKYLKITIETDEKKEVFGNFIEPSKPEGQNAGPASEGLTTESVSTGIIEIGSDTYSHPINGGAPAQFLLEALQMKTSQNRTYTSVTDNGGPAPSDVSE
jgi:hypothetical protein